MGGRGGGLSDSEHVMFTGTRWASLIIAEPADIWVSRLPFDFLHNLLQGLRSMVLKRENDGIDLWAPGTVTYVRPLL